MSTETKKNMTTETQKVKPKGRVLPFPAPKLKHVY